MQLAEDFINKYPGQLKAGRNPDRQDSARAEKEALAAAASYFSRVGSASVTTGKLRAHLLKRSFTADLVDRVVADLVEAGYLDDYERALAVIAARRGSRSEGRRALRQRMYKLGIHPSAADEALALLEESEEERALEFLLTKRRRDIEQLVLLLDDKKDYYKLKNKVLMATCRRGFSSGTATAALDLALDEVTDK